MNKSEQLTLECLIDLLNIIDDDSLIACLKQYYFEPNSPIQNQRVRKIGYLIKPSLLFAYIKKPSISVIEQVALHDPEILKYVKNSSDEIQLKVLNINLKYIRYFRTISIKIQHEAVNLYNNRNIYNHDFIPIFLKYKHLTPVVLLKLLDKTDNKHHQEMIKKHKNYKNDAKIILSMIK